MKSWDVFGGSAVIVLFGKARVPGKALNKCGGVSSENVHKTVWNAVPIFSFLFLVDIWDINHDQTA